MIIKRAIAKRMEQLLKQYPIVSLLGPRQSGKTTLAKEVCQGYSYVNMELPINRIRFAEDPLGFMINHPCPVIFDEVQQVPELLSYLQVEADRLGGTGLYVVTGIHQPRLRAAITQSLAGRVALLELLPLSIAELKENGIQIERDSIMLQGFMPRLYRYSMNAYDLYENYYKTYVERDVAQLIHLRDIHTFAVFMQLLAGRAGQLLNMASLARDVGVSAVTIKEWISLLEASYIVTLVRPYHNNFGKRLTKSPKLYFIETGLLCFLLGLHTEEQIKRDPLVGHIFENMVVMELLKTKYNENYSADLYFYHSDRGAEIDILLSNRNELTPVEIRAAYSYKNDFSKNLTKFVDLAKCSNRGFIIYAGETHHATTGPDWIHFSESATVMNSILSSF